MNHSITSSNQQESNSKNPNNSLKKSNPLFTSNAGSHVFDFITSFAQASQISVLVDLLKIDPFQRTDKDCKQIARVLHDKQYFKKITNSKILQQISSKLRYRLVPQGNFVYKLNQMAESFYIMIDGHIDLIVPQNIALFNQDDPLEYDDSDIRLTSLSNIESRISQLNLSQLDSNISNKSKQIDRQQNQQRQPKFIVEDRVVLSVKQWQAFGEITLNQTNKRAASAYAKSDTHLIEVRRLEYELINKSNIVTENRQKFLLIQDLPLFKKVYKYSIQGFIYYMEKQLIQYNRVLFVQDDPINLVYIVAQGNFKLQKTVHKRVTFSNVKNRRMTKKKNQQLNQFLKNYTGQKDSNNRPKNNIEALKTDNSPEKRLSYKIVGRGEILGDTECVLGSSYPLYQQTCTCVSETGVIYAIPRKIFIDKLLSPQNQLDQINKILCHKNQVRRKQFGKSYLKHSQDKLFQQYLPLHKRKTSQISKKSHSKEKISAQKQKKNMYLTFSTNLFMDFNRTFNKQSIRSGRIRRAYSQSISDGSSNSLSSQKQWDRQRKIPSTVKDIVKIMKFKDRYHKMRTQNTKQPAFQFDNNNVPLHIKQKYKQLFQKLQKPLK